MTWCVIPVGRDIVGSHPNEAHVMKVDVSMEKNKYKNNEEEDNKTTTKLLKRSAIVAVTRFPCEASKYIEGFVHLAYVRSCFSLSLSLSLSLPSSPPSLILTTGAYDTYRRR